MAETVRACSIRSWKSCHAPASMTTSAGLPFTVRTEGRPVSLSREMNRVVLRVELGKRTDVLGDVHRWLDEASHLLTSANIAIVSHCLPRTILSRGNLTPGRLRRGRTSFGTLLETFVHGEILKLASWSR